jgi:hypothetical protein
LYIRVSNYTEVWAKRDESKNYQQKHVTDLAKNKVMPEVEEEVAKKKFKIIIKLLNIFNKYLIDPSSSG